MAQHNKEALKRQVQLECKGLEGTQKLAFRELLSEERIMAALERAKVVFRKRDFEAEKVSGTVKTKRLYGS